MHRLSGRWKLGMALALLASACWGILPIALKVALEGLDPYTLTWYRFTAAAAVLGTILAVSGHLPKCGTLNRRSWLLLLVALAGLAGNYVLYVVALTYSTPTVTQTVIQLGPLFFLLGGLVVFRESFSRLQSAGVALLVLGLILFFNRRLPELGDLSGLGFGFVLLVIAALVWAIYGLAQKQLLKQLGSQQILLLIYLGAVVVLFPPTSLGEIRHLTTMQFWMLAFTCANTLIAYGAFAEALQHWETSRIGAILALAPLFTLGGMWLAEALAPGLVPPEKLNVLSVLGALLVVCGSAICALGAANRPQRSE